MSRSIRQIMVVACVLVITGVASAQLTPVKAFVGATRPVLLELSEPGPASAPRAIAIYDGKTRAELARTRVPDPPPPGGIDLREFFPALLDNADPGVMYAQLLEGGLPIGAPVVLAPMTTPRIAASARTAAIVGAFDQRDDEAMGRLRAMTKEQLDTLATDIVFRDPPARVCAGYRLYLDRFVELETSFGTLTIALRPDAAPITCETFMRLAEGGFYDGVSFHRIVPLDRLGRPFVVQAGDPTATGDGGPGFSIDFEPSTLPHDFGVVSMARELDDPNSNGSQFFIALSREGCSRLDGRFTAFAEVIGGGEVLDAIAAAPVGARNPEDPASAADRPLDPPLILSARTVPATPITARPARITRAATAGVER